MWGEQKAREMLGYAGFASVELLPVDYDPVNNYYLARLQS